MASNGLLILKIWKIFFAFSKELYLNNEGFISESSKLFLTIFSVIFVLKSYSFISLGFKKKLGECLEILARHLKQYLQMLILQGKCFLFLFIFVLLNYFFAKNTFVSVCHRRSQLNCIPQKEHFYRLFISNNAFQYEHFFYITQKCPSIKAFFLNCSLKWGSFGGSVEISSFKINYSWAGKIFFKLFLIKCAIKILYFVITVIDFFCK